VLKNGSALKVKFCVNSNLNADSNMVSCQFTILWFSIAASKVPLHTHSLRREGLVETLVDDSLQSVDLEALRFHADEWGNSPGDGGIG
jgi:hypothetical protein